MTEGFEQTRYGLIRKRAAMVAEIETLQAQAAKLVADLNALETVIRVFDPNIDMEELPIRRIPPAYAAFRGEMARFMLITLREHAGGLTTHELALLIMRSRQINVNDMQAVKLMQRRTGHSLSRLRSNGYVISEKANAGGMLRWRISLRGGRDEPTGRWRNGSGYQGEL
ncbi:hypothetical protein [Blastomonas sp.]|uniref:hypothetical protein n=1 Tax=Blastomonas sp. TaxID=1909299 RepID=UPI0035946114